MNTNALGVKAIRTVTRYQDTGGRDHLRRVDAEVGSAVHAIRRLLEMNYDPDQADETLDLLTAPGSPAPAMFVALAKAKERQAAADERDEVEALRLEALARAAVIPERAEAA